MSEFMQAVRVGDQQRVHLRSAVQRNFTRCGLREDPPLLTFRNTLAEPTCVFCTQPEPVRKSA